MDCPACQTPNLSKQKFCGSCGHKLEATCAQCGAANPPQYKFCGECGSLLSKAGAIVLARSGLITRADQKALDLLGRKAADVQGKPFSLFVDRADLVVFFSHLNELHSSSHKTSFEITLKHADGKRLYVLVEGRAHSDATETPNEVHLSFAEITDSRQSSALMQYQQDLLSLIFAITDNISAVSKKHLDLAIGDALKKIGLFAQADHCFIYGINRRAKCLEPVYHWCQAASSDDSGKLKRVPLVMVKRTIVRLRRSQAYVINDVAKLAASERYELLAWHKADLGALICHLVYSGKQPIGVIGLAKNTADTDWAPDCVALVKFFGQFMADKLSISTRQKDADLDPRPAARVSARPRKRTRDKAPDNVIDISAKQPIPDAPSAPPPADPIRQRLKPDSRVLPDMTRPMLLEKSSGTQMGDQQPVFPRDDGLILLTCPRCGLQESVTMDRFHKLGNAIRVDCPCRKQFTAVLEKRRSFRKVVQLDGYFSLKGDLGPVDAQSSIWGPMVVKDLSKAGLRFFSEKADLVHTGDLLMVRFNLDNSNQALIHKQVKVISVTNDEVGCRFEGSDSYDITLGFYFI